MILLLRCGAVHLKIFTDTHDECLIHNSEHCFSICVCVWVFDDEIAHYTNVVVSWLDEMLYLKFGSPVLVAMSLPLYIQFSINLLQSLCSSVITFEFYRLMSNDCVIVCVLSAGIFVFRHYQSIIAWLKRILRCHIFYFTQSTIYSKSLWRFG